MIISLAVSNATCWHLINGYCGSIRFLTSLAFIIIIRIIVCNVPVRSALMMPMLLSLPRTPPILYQVCAMHVIVV